MIDTAKIKANILSCAFKGILVAYFEEKTNYALDGLHKRVKKYVPVSEDEYLIDAPKRWRWSRLGYVTNNHGQKEPQEDFCYIDVGTLDNVNHCLAKKENLVNKEDAPSRARKIVEQGDVLYSTVRPYLHNICIINKEFSKTPVASTAFCVMAVEREVLINKFLFYWLLSAEFDKFSNGNPSKGTLYPAIGEKDLLNGVIPIPCVEEQQLIVEKIDSAFECLDKLNRLQTQYSSDLEILKSKIIDAGIQGRLTEQLPEDGTADELLEQIREKKDQMIKDGLIPKESKSQIINDEDKSFETPKNWAYARVQDVATYITDYVANGSFATLKANTTTYKEPNYAVFVRTLDLGAEFKNDLSYIDEASYEFLKKSKLYGGELILPNIGASIGKAFIMPDLGMPMSLAPNSVMVKFENNVMNKYFYYVFQSSYGKGILMNIQGGAATPKFSKTDLRKMVVMLPPLAEQERIVNRIEEIFALI